MRDHAHISVVVANHDRCLCGDRVWDRGRDDQMGQQNGACTAHREARPQASTEQSPVVPIAQSTASLNPSDGRGDDVGETPPRAARRIGTAAASAAAAAAWSIVAFFAHPPTAASAAATLSRSTVVGEGVRNGSGGVSTRHEQPATTSTMALTSALTASPLRHLMGAIMTWAVDPPRLSGNFSNGRERR